MAAKPADAIEAGVGYADFSGFFGDDRNRQNWAAVDATIDELIKDGNSDWRDESQFDDFIKKAKQPGSIA